MIKRETSHHLRHFPNTHKWIGLGQDEVIRQELRGLRRHRCHLLPARHMIKLLDQSWKQDPGSGTLIWDVGNSSAVPTCYTTTLTSYKYLA